MEVTHPTVGVAAAALYDHPGGGEVQLVISPDIVDIVDIIDIIDIVDMRLPDGEDGEVVAGELGRDDDLVVLGLHARLGGEGRHHAVTVENICEVYAANFCLSRICFGNQTLVIFRI